MSYIAKLIVVCLMAALGATSAFSIERPPAVAGTFYPADSSELADMVKGHLSQVEGLPEIDGQLIALIVPHAGLVYSGQIAAYSYKLLEKSNVNRVILCGPSHRFGFDGVSVYGPGVSWRTPLGAVMCDDDLCNQALAYNQFSVIEEAQQPEHCLEVQLPYLQTVLTQFSIVPLLVGYPEPLTVQLLADVLSKLSTGTQTVMIASTDWQHYRPASEGWKLDSVGLACIEKLDPDALQRYLDEGRTEACGGAAAVAVMRAAKTEGANKVKILKYGDSGDVSGDKDGVVGYVAAAIYRAASREEEQPHIIRQPRGKKDEPQTFELTEAEKKTLLEIARASIENHLLQKPMPDFALTDRLNQQGAAFVTLTKKGQLRGCIGYTAAFRRLYHAVSECAVKAAVEDPRFQPVKADELPDIHIEISVLTPLQKVNSLDEIEVGRDGLMITLERQRGLLLPQVAVENGWDRKRFLEETCRKAGLLLQAYRSPDAVIEKFQAIIFSEEE